MLARLLVTVVVGLALMQSGKAAEFLPDEILSFQSRTFSDAEFLSGKAVAGQPTTLKASLRLPSSAGRHPVIILMHGSDGKDSSAVNGWRSALLKLGYANLRIDHFTGRGEGAIGGDLGAISSFAQVYDAYRAIELLATDDRIDGDRVVLMGFSRGGIAALYAGLLRFQALYGPQAGRSVGYLSFYPACNFELGRGLETDGMPIRHFHGAADDQTSAAVCSAYIKALAGAGADARSFIYPGALHAFDASLARRPFRDDDVQYSHDCMRVEGDGGVLLNRDTGAPFSYADACVGQGSTVQFDPEATAAALATVTQLLADWIGPPAP
jgi:dienelactone hydrolase